MTSQEKTGGGRRQRFVKGMLGGLALLFALGIRLLHSPGSSDADITVWLSADTLGYLEPCGCRRDQAGGLPVRMTLVGSARTPNRLLVDAGNITSGGRSHELLKFDYILRGMALMGYDAVNLGRREVNLDRDTLLQRVNGGSLPFLSCNVLDRRTSSPLAAPSLVRQVGGVRVGITGIVQADPQEVGPGLAVRPPLEALAAVLPGLQKQSDFLLVLAFAPADTQREIAAKFPEVGAVLGGDVPQSSGMVEKVNRTALFSVTEKGKVIGRLKLRRDREGGLTVISGQAFKTADKIQPSAPAVTLIKEYKNVLRERNLAYAVQEGLEPVHTGKSSADTYVGQERCVTCHASAHRMTAASAHAHAFQTLISRGSEYDPDCIRCHSVGYGARDGFWNLQKTPHLANVQCESCHGRASAHLEAVQAGKVGRDATAMFAALTPSRCVSCHDEENSANFRYATFWPQIRHGAEPGAKRR